MSRSRHPFRPYSNRKELSKGKTQVFLSVAISMVAAVLAKYSAAAVGDDRLAQLYVVAALMYLLASLGPAIRWSNTPAFDTAD
jgi:hypothetical protein